MAVRTQGPMLSHVTVPHHADFNGLTDLTLGFVVRVEVAPAVSEVDYWLAKEEAGVSSTFSVRYTQSSAGVFDLICAFGTGAAVKTATHTYTFEVGRYYAVKWTYLGASNITEVFVAAMGSARSPSTIDAAYTSLGQTAFAGGPFTLASNSNAIIIGAANSTSGTILLGSSVSIGEVLIYSAVASPTLGTRLVGNETNMIGYWPLDDGLDGVGGTTAVNLTGTSAKNGTLVNGASWADPPTSLSYPIGTTSGPALLGLYDLVRIPTGTITADEEDADFPAINVRRGSPAAPWKTTGSGSHNVVFAHGRDEVAHVLTVFGHTLTASATVTIERNATDSWGSPTVSERVRFHAGSLVHVFTRPWQFAFTRLTFSGVASIGTVNLWRCVELTPHELETRAGGAEAVTLDPGHSPRAVRTMATTRTRALPPAQMTISQSLALWDALQEVGGGRYAWWCADVRRGLYAGSYGALNGSPSLSIASTGAHAELSGLQIWGDP